MLIIHLVKMKEIAYQKEKISINNWQVTYIKYTKKLNIQSYIS